MSTSVFSGVRSTLRQVLQNIPELSSGWEFAWEGRKYKPTIGQAYVREELIPIDSPVESLGTNGLVREDFIYQLSVFSPTNDGLFAQEDLVDAIRAVFRSGSQIRHSDDQEKNGIVVQSSRSQAIIDSDFRMIPITINAYVYRPITMS